MVEDGDFGGDGGTVEDWNKFSAVIIARMAQYNPYCRYLSYPTFLDSRMIETDCTGETRLLILSVLTDSDAANCNFHAGELQDPSFIF